MQLFTEKTQSFIYNRRERPVKGMLDFDFLCGREAPSVAAIIHPTGREGFMKVPFGMNEILIPVYPSLEKAARKHPNVDMLINFASRRSAAESLSLKAVQDPWAEQIKHEVEEAFAIEQLRTVAVIAEGIPERWTRGLIVEAARLDKILIGPSTVGGIFPGKVKIGNTGGLPENIIATKLYRPGSVGLVTQSGGMLNEMCSIISQQTNGIYGGIAIGGDTFPGSTFLDWLLYYEQIPEVKMCVMLGEIGGTLEYEVAEAISAGRITKPLMVWCIGTCAEMFKTPQQFGHSGANSEARAGSARAKNEALREAGAIVPESFDDFGEKINAAYRELVEQKTIIVKPEPPVPVMPMDYAEAVKKGIVRPRPASVVSSICDETGDEHCYNSIPISQVVEEGFGIGGVAGLLWWKEDLPQYARDFIELALVILADHGPCVAGADSVIDKARAGKGLEESVASGIGAIGPRFGGAIANAVKEFWSAFKGGLTPKQFVDRMKAEKKLIPGIGHKIKSLDNPDKRVEIIKAYARKHFPSTPLLDYAEEVELITTIKLPTLILNVDGCIGICVWDMLCAVMGEESAEEYMPALNAFFILGRTIGFIGHWIDQVIRLKQPLLRRLWDDVLYLQ